MSIDDLKEKIQIWEDINLMLHKQGFWLYDDGNYELIGCDIIGWDISGFHSFLCNSLHKG